MHFALGVRGDVSTITTRYCRANNRYLSWYEPNKKMVYLLDLDANNMYGGLHMYVLYVKCHYNKIIHTHSNEIQFNINRLGHESTTSHR